MPPRKAKKTPSKQAETAPTDSATSAAVSKNKKRKIDWATIDEPELFEGFTLKSVASSKRRKSGHAQKPNGSPATDGTDVLGDGSLSADITQTNPFPEAALSATHYAVEPAHIWESTKRYRKFTISEAEFEVGQCVFIEKSPEEQDSEDAIQYWVGRVLEVRAGDASHVYLRVYWFYRPEDLPEGRQPHHGESELIASNHMDIIEALSVSDKADVIYWDEDPEKPWPLKHQLFWRQTFDLRTTKSKQFSPIRKICVDKKPCNPDEPLVQCPSCSVWLHGQCLEDSAVLYASNNRGPLGMMASSGSMHSGPRSGSSSSSSSEPTLFTAHLSTLGASGTTYLTVTDHQPDTNMRRYNVDITCLNCKALIEAAPEDIPPEPPVTTRIAALIETAISTLVPGTEVPSGPMADPSTNPNVRKRGRPRKNPLPVQDVAIQPEPAHDQQEQGTPVPAVVAHEVTRERGPPRENPLPSTNMAVEQEQVEYQHEQDTPGPAMVADDGKEEPKPEPYTPVPAAASVGQSMFGSMRKMLFRGGV